MRKKMRFVMILYAIVGMALTIPSKAFAGEVVVIANPNIPADSLSSNDVKNIFLAKKTQWDDGQKINFVTLKSGQTHDDFLKKYLGKSTSQFQRYFRTLVFTGKGSAPKSFDSGEAVVGFVTGTDGAIGYVSSATTTGYAKVLTIN